MKCFGSIGRSRKEDFFPIQGTTGLWQGMGKPPKRTRPLVAVQYPEWIRSRSLDSTYRACPRDASGLALPVTGSLTSSFSHAPRPLAAEYCNIVSVAPHFHQVAQAKVI